MDKHLIKERVKNNTPSNFMLQEAPAKTFALHLQTNQLGMKTLVNQLVFQSIY